MDVFEAINQRRSVREYNGAKLNAGVKAKLLAAMRSAPSACNIQPWRFVVVEDAAAKEKLARLCKEQMWLAKAGMIVVGCAVTDEAYKKMGGYGNSSDIDVAIALDHLSLAAAALGLGTCWIGAYDEAAVKKLLGIPEGVKTVAIMPVGEPAKEGMNHPLIDTRRKAADEIFMEEKWGD